MEKIRLYRLEAVIILTMLLSSTYASAHATHLSIPSEVMTIEIDGELKEHLKSLDESERFEQCRDWIKYSIIQQIAKDDEERFELLYDFNPLRYQEFESLSDFEYGAYRYILLDNSAIAIIPSGSSKKNVYISHISDQFRMLRTKQPDVIQIVEFTIDEGHSTINYQFTEEISGDEIFSDKYGYTMKLVRNKDDLDAFLKSIDDITYAEKSSNGIILAGRKYENTSQDFIKLEDIYVLYQADNNVKEQYLNRLGDRGVYNEFISAKKQLIDEFPGMYSINEIIDLFHNEIAESQAAIDYNSRYLDSFSPSDRLMVPSTNSKLLQQIKDRKDDILYLKNFETYQSYFKYLLAEGLPAELESNIGFSLDPKTNSQEIAKDIRYILESEKNYEIWFEEKVKLSLLRKLNESNRPENSERIERWFDVEKLNRKEQSLQSFIEYTFPENEEDVDDYRSDIEESDPEKMITEQLAYFRESMYTGIPSHSELLEQLADWIENKQGKESSETLSLFYVIDAYFSKRYPFKFGSGYNADASVEKFEEVLYDQIVKDVSEMLGLENDRFDRELVEEINNYRMDNGLEENGIIDNELFEHLFSDQSLLSTFLYEFEGIGSFLDELRIANTYQSARYDGDLQGTEVGMTLFYTDVLMKIWSMDFGNTSPEGILGFVPQIYYPIDVTHKKSFELNPGTRSWLAFDEKGLRNEGNSKLYFNHTATKIFNASSNDLLPGVETEAVFSSKRFADWWNSNYNLIADQEPEYHRLNQIQKWSAIINWLKEIDRLSWLDKKDLKLTRDLGFNDWYRKTEALTVSTDLPFIPENKIEEKTESLELIRSKYFYPFSNSSVIYSLSGGVSLNNKLKLIKRFNVTPRINIAKAKVNRVNVDPFETTGVKVKFLDGKSFDLQKAISKTTVSNSNVGMHYSKSSLYNKLDLERQISDNGISQSSKGNIKVGDFNHEFKGNSVLLSAEKSDLKKINQLVDDVVEKGRYSDNVDEFFFDSQLVDDAKIIQDNQSILVKLKGSEPYYQITRTKIPVGPKDASIADNVVMRIAKDSESYFDVKVLKNDELVKILDGYDNLIITKSQGNISKVHLSKDPLPEGETINFIGEKGSIQVSQFEGGWAIPNISDDLVDDISRMLQESDDVLRSSKSDFSGILFDKTGKPTYFSKGNINQAGLDDILDAVTGMERHADNIVFNEIDDLRFLGNRTLTIPKPSNTNPIDKDLLEKIANKIDDNSKFKDLWTKNSVDQEDFARLDKLKTENFELSESYYKFKQTKNLKSDEALLDLSSRSDNFQYVVKNAGDDLPRVVTKNSADPKSMHKIQDDIKQLFTDASISDDVAKQRFDEYSKLIFDQLDEIATSSGASKIITRGDQVNLQQIYSYHRGNKVFFYADEPENVEKSISHSRSDFSLNFDDVIFCATPDVTNSQYPEVTAQLEYIDSSDIYAEYEVGIWDFESILLSDIQQIILMVRTDGDGLIFSDGFMSFEQIDYIFQNMEDDSVEKKLIYIITNDCDLLQEKFSSSGSFEMVYTSCYVQNDPSSLEYALQGVKVLVEPLVEDYYEVNTKFLYKQLDGNVMAESIYNKCTIASDKLTKLNLNKLSAEERNALPEKIVAKLNKMRTVKKPTSIKSVLNNYSQQELIKFKSGEIPFKSRFKAIPRLKVEIQIPLEVPEMIYSSPKELFG